MKSAARIIAGAAVAALCSVFLIAVPAQAVWPPPYDVEVNGYQFTYSAADPSAGATIVYYAGADTALTLPDSVTVASVIYPVTTIANSALSTLGLTSVTIPSSVTYVDNFAFADNALTSVSISDSLAYLGAFAFKGNLLTTVTIPDSVTYVGPDAFQSNLLTSVTIGSSVATIGAFAFDVNDLTSVTIPDSVTTIGDGAFRGCPLSSVTMLGDAPSTIGTSVFGVGGGATPVVSYYARNAGYTSPTWVAGTATYASRGLVTVSWEDGLGGGLVTADEVASSVPAPAVSPTTDGHQFLGWTAVQNVGPTLAFPRAVASDTTFYAIWGTRSVTSPAAAPAGTSFDVSGSGFEAGETVEVSITPDPALLATLTSSGTGTISATVSLDASTPAGAHQLVFTGSITGATSNALTVEDYVLPTATADGVVYTADPRDPAAGATATSVALPVVMASDLVIPSTVVVDGVTYPVTAIGAHAFQNTGLTSLTLPDSVVTIGDYAFYGNDLTSVTIPASVTSIGLQAFDANPLDSVLMEGPVPTSIVGDPFGPGGGATPVVSYYARNSGYTPTTWLAGSQWYTSKALVTATFDAGIGTGGTTVDAALAADVAAPTPPTAEGNRFLGWTAVDGVGPVLTFPVGFGSDATLYALWEEREVTSPAKATAGASFAVSGSGFEPGETVEVWLHSDPVLLTTLTASVAGTIDASLLLSSGTPAGAHQLVFTGAETGTTANDITIVEIVLAESGFNAEALTWLAILLIFAGASLRLVVTVRRMRVRA